jgi:transposase
MQGQKSPERSAQGVYVGVDVCKDWLDAYLHPIGQAFRVANTPEGLKAFKRRIVELSVEMIVMEATGKFHRQAHRTLHAAGFAVAVVNPLRARLFAEAVGQLAKTDRLDARVLALMGQALEPSAIAPAPEAIEALQELARARSAAKADQTALSNQRGASQTAFLKAELGRRLKVLAGHIERLDAEIERRLGADSALKRRFDILLTIPGVGPVAALALVVGLPELGACSAKAGERHIKGGRAFVRTGLYFAAVAAARCNPQLSDDYKRLRDAGKKAKVAITAIMRKLVVLANVLIKEDRPWTPIHA